MTDLTPKKKNQDLVILWPRKIYHYDTLVYHDHSIIKYQRKYGIELNTFPKLLGVLVNMRELTVNDAQDIAHLMNHNISKYLYDIPDPKCLIRNNCIIIIYIYIYHSKMK